MGVSVTPLLWAAACAPIGLLLLLMVRFRWGAAQAAPVALLAATLSGFWLYAAPLQLIGIEVAKGIWNSIAIITVVFPAILIFEITVAAGAIDSFRRGMQQLSPDELLQVLAIGWVFVSFLQGVTGFGVPVAVGAGLLLGIGVSPLWAVIFSLLGQAWGNTFGTLALAWDALILQAGLTDTGMIKSAGLWAAGFIWLIDFASGAAIAWFYGGICAIRRSMPAIFLVSLIHGGGQLLLSQMNATIANFVPSCVALAAIMLIGRFPPYNRPYAYSDSPVIHRVAGQTNEAACPAMSLPKAFLPYLILVGVTLAVLLISPLESALGAWKVGITVPKTVTGYGFVNKAAASYSPIAVGTHAGTFLLLAALAGWGFYIKSGYLPLSKSRSLLHSALQKTLPSAIAVFSLVAMAKIMAGTGQIDVLAQGIADVSGVWYILASPFVGVVGSFMTSSNMSSNILFAGFQDTMARLLQVDPALLLAAQTAGGAIGSVIAPSKILLGTATTGIVGVEGVALGKMIPLTAVLAMIIGIITLSRYFLI